MQYHERLLKIDGERVWRDYIGGRELDRLDGKSDPKDGRFPEEWMFSATRAVNVGREDIEEGICRLSGSDGKISLKRIIEENPRAMLGEAHAGEYGNSMGVLVKLIDSQVRLVIQAHPDKAAAKRLLNSRFGKTESWHVLGMREDGGEDACMYLGFKEGVTREEWKRRFDAQDREGMLAMMHRVVPKPGDTFIVHGGVPHAIGSGCLVIEIQEPTDMTIRLERKMSFGAELPDISCHLGLGFDRMFDCFHYDGKSERQVLDDWRLKPETIEKNADFLIESLVGYSVTPCFKMERLDVFTRMTIAAGGRFSGLYVKDGDGEALCGGERIPLKTNGQFFIPAMCRDIDVVNAGKKPLQLFRLHGPRI